MNILVTGSSGFVGKNLVAALDNIRQGKDRMHPACKVDEIFTYDLDTPKQKLDEYAARADFVFHLAGVNRPKDESAFLTGNFGFSKELLNALKHSRNACPVMLSSSVQASLEGRFADSAYGRSKKAGEDLFFEYGKDSGANVYVYRFPNLFGKWCRPNYNSAVATFCHNIANGLPVTVHDENTQLELVYIDDLVETMLGLLCGKADRCEYDGVQVKPNAKGRFCYVPTAHRATLGEIVGLLRTFAEQPKTLTMPTLPADSFAKKLYSTYLSYLPKEKVAFPLEMKEDARGSFTEIMKTAQCGQFSVNVSKPSVTKGEHWHNTKWEFFIVVSGRARIEQRKIGSDEVWTFDVSGDKIEAVHMLPGYTHNIINLSDSENLVTLMWANEPFDAQRPDTFYERVERN